MTTIYNYQVIDCLNNISKEFSDYILINFQD